MPNINLDGTAFEVRDGMSFDFGTLPKAVVVNALNRAFSHVFNNEARSGADAARKHKGISDAEYSTMIAEKQDKLFADVMAGTWGDRSSRATRTPGMGRLDQIIANLFAVDTRAKLAKDVRYKAGDVKDTWVTASGTVFDLSQAVAAFKSHPELGPDRIASVEQRAQRQYDKEMADAADRKAAAAREAASGGLDI